MSLQPLIVQLVPEETARVARAAFRKGNPYLRLYDQLGPLYTDQQFAALFPTRGQPGLSPAQLAVVTVLQFAEGLSDRQAADAVRSRIDWKYVLGLELTDAGFDFSVLSEFRDRLLAGSAELLLLTALLERGQAAGVLKVRGRQRTDATGVLAAIRALNRLELVGETLRHALEVLATVAPEWLRGVAPPAWFARYGRRLDEYRLPKEGPARLALAAQIGADGRRLLTATHAPTAPAWLREVPAVATLRRVWVQQYHAPDEGEDQDQPPRWRGDDELPPAARLVASPHDPEARYGTKRETSWTGYKVHLTETCDPDAPHLVTDVQTTAATTPDDAVTGDIHTALAARDLLPRLHLVDAGYVAARHLATAREAHGVDLLGPAPADTQWQARAGAGFAATDFALDWAARQATCPQGHPSARWSATDDAHPRPLVTIRFARADCAACPARARCTRSAAGPRVLTVRPEAQHRALQAARARQATPAFAAEYAARAGIEGTLSLGIRACDLRRTRYLGLAKTHLGHICIAAALNVARLAAWFAETPRARTRRSAFATLAPAA
jgi:transposase